MRLLVKFPSNAHATKPNMTHINPSKLLDTNIVPSTLNPTAVNGSLCAGNSLNTVPCLTSHKITRSSHEPVAKTLDFGLKARQVTCEVCLVRVRRQVPWKAGVGI